MKTLFIACLALLASGCMSIPEPTNGVTCYDLRSAAPWNTNASIKGVNLAADVDVTSVSAGEWIELYQAFCGG